MSRLPSSVQVFGHDITVQEKEVANGDLGESSDDDKLITVSPRQSAAAQQATLFHEVVHMCLALGGVSYALDDKLEEAVVRCLEHGLWPLVQFRKFK